MGGMGGPMGVGKSRSKIQMEPQTGVSFKDVAGADGLYACALPSSALDMEAMVEKTNTRRQRGKREAFFLESVREVLQSMSAELAEVKTCIKEVQASQLFHVYSNYVGMPQKTWDTLSMWYPTEYTGSNLDTEQTWNAEATCHPAFSERDSLNRDTLLAFRNLSPGMQGGLSLPNGPATDLNRKLSGDATQVCSCNYKQWRSTSTDVFVAGSPLRKELEQEAAVFIQRWVRHRNVVEIDSAPPGCSDCDLCSVWLTLDEWKIATGMTNLANSCVASHWAGANQGLRDFDTGLWYRVASIIDPPQEKVQVWPMGDIQSWYSRVLQQSEQDAPFQDRIRHLVLSWIEARKHIPEEARLLIAEGLFKHARFLQQCFYQDPVTPTRDYTQRAST
jgi:hypothetical protein